MCVHSLVWSGLKHCRYHKNEAGSTKYQPGAAKEVVLSWDEAGTTSFYMNCSEVDHTNTNINTDNTTNKRHQSLQTH